MHYRKKHRRRRKVTINQQNNIIPANKKDPIDTSLNLNQNRLVEKINLYLKSKGRKNKDGSDYQIPEGYCHGLTLVWLQKMAEGKVQWFYDVNRKIIQCDDDKLEDMELDIEKFLSMIEWAQKSYLYTNNTISYNNVDLILETEPQQSFDKSYTTDQLKDMLTYKRGKGHMICISNCEANKKIHSVGIFTDGNHYHFYDPNYHSGQAMCFRSSRELTTEVMQRLYTNLNRAIPPIAQLEIKLVSHPDITYKTNLDHAHNPSRYSLTFWKPDSKKLDTHPSSADTSLDITKSLSMH